MKRSHVCKEASHCICDVAADEPDEKCYKHGWPWPPTCGTCGRFVKRIYGEKEPEPLEPEEDPRI